MGKFFCRILSGRGGVVQDMVLGADEHKKNYPCRSSLACEADITQALFWHYRHDAFAY